MQITTKHCIVFDTNVYSDVSKADRENPDDDVLSKLIADEAMVGSKAFASPTVMFEMIVGWDEAPADQKRKAQEGIQALVQHCLKSSGNLNILADEQSIGCNLVFGEIPEWLNETNHACASICKTIASGTPLSEMDVSTISQLKEAMHRQEQGFIDGMKKVQSHIDPQEDRKSQRNAFDKYIKTDEWLHSYGSMILDKCCNAMGRKIEGGERAQAIKKLLEINHASFNLWSSFFVPLLFQNANPARKKRQNLIWDCQILSAAENLNIAGNPLMLVTTDQAMLNAAADLRSSLGERTCISYLDYKEWIKQRLPKSC
jgi:hypothetical protein